MSIKSFLTRNTADDRDHVGVYAIYSPDFIHVGRLTNVGVARRDNNRHDRDRRQGREERTRTDDK